MFDGNKSHNDVVFFNLFTIYFLKILGLMISKLFVYQKCAKNEFGEIALQNKLASLIL